MGEINDSHHTDKEQRILKGQKISKHLDLLSPYMQGGDQSKAVKDEYLPRGWVQKLEIHWPIKTGEEIIISGGGAFKIMLK